MQLVSSERGVPAFLREIFFREVGGLSFDVLVDMRGSPPEEFYLLMDRVIFHGDLLEYTATRHFELMQGILDYFSNAIDDIIVKELKTLKNKSCEKTYNKKIDKLLKGVKYERALRFLTRRV